MKTIGELNFVVDPRREVFFSQVLQLPVVWKTFSDDDLNDPLGTVQRNSDCDGILLSQALTANFLSSSEKIPIEVIEAGLVDSVIRSNGKLWARCFLKEALRQSILNKAPSLDTHSIAYITGSDELTRLALVVAAHAGFRKMIVVSLDPELAEARVAQLKRLFFDLDIQVIKDFELTLQPNNGSLLINTYTADNGGEVFADLTYLNFLKPDGLVVDLPFSSDANDLLKEADHVKVLTLTGVEILGARDFFFLRAVLGSEMSLSLPEYLLAWQNFVIPFTTVENQT